MGIPRFILSDFMLQYSLRGIALGTPLHEYCHLVTLHLLGGSGEILSTALNQMQPMTYTYWQLVGAAYAGGVISGLIWLLLSLRDGDEENRLISQVLAINHVAYGLFEGTAYLLGRYELIGAGSLIGGTLMVGVIAAYILTRLQQVVPT